MRRIEADGREDGFELAMEEVREPLAFAVRAIAPLRALAKANALRVEEREQHVVEDAVLLVHHFVRRLGDAPQLLRRREVVRPALGRPERPLLLQAGDADLEELVENRTGDAQEPQPLEERHVLALGEVEHAAVELQLRQLAVDVQRGAVELRRFR